MGAFSGRTVHAKFPSSDSSRCKLAQSPEVDLSLSMENEGLLSIPSTEMSLKTIEVQLCYHLGILVASWTSSTFNAAEWNLVKTEHSSSKMHRLHRCLKPEVRHRVWMVEASLCCREHHRMSGSWVCSHSEYRLLRKQVKAKAKQSIISVRPPHICSRCTI